MTKAVSTLHSFLSEKLAARGFEPDEETLRALSSAIVIEEGEPDESEETRTVHLKEGTDGKKGAESVKWYNMMRISYQDLINLIFKALKNTLVEDAALKLIFGAVDVILEFYPKLTISFNEQDAKLLWLMYGLNQKQVTVDELAQAWRSQYNDALPADQPKRSLDSFHELRIVRAEGNSTYTIREKHVYERNV